MAGQPRSAASRGPRGREVDRAAATPSPGGTVGEPRCGHHSTPTPSNAHNIISKPHTTYNNPLHTSRTGQPDTHSQSTPTVRNPSSKNGNKRELSKVDMFCSSTSREGRRVRDERRHRHPLAAEPGEARSDTVRRRGRKPGRTGGRRRRKEPPPNLTKHHHTKLNAFLITNGTFIK